ncbi:MAG TPA: hypothetical protein VLG28_13540 [Acidimicrobiia bacterium]|jgi:hypothetical protein|nr:hypothetical protein [Acidimicrobiia bacterium]
MLVMALFFTILPCAAGLVVYMATHGDADVVAAVEHEVGQIRRETARGWKTRRVLRHHRAFCACQVDYLRRTARV